MIEGETIRGHYWLFVAVLVCRALVLLGSEILRVDKQKK